MKQEIEKKVKYYEAQLDEALNRFLNDNTRKSRDIVIRLKERLKIYKEVLKLIP
jgi:energy-converting hydrogenase A subunit M